MSKIYIAIVPDTDVVKSYKADHQRSSLPQYLQYSIMYVYYVVRTTSKNVNISSS